MHDMGSDRLEEGMNEVLKKIDYLDHHIEHELASVSDHIDTVTSKLKKREDSSDTRIENLEEEIKKQVEGSIGSRLSKLELQFKTSKFSDPRAPGTNDKRTGAPFSKGGKEKESLEKPGSGCSCSNWPFYISILFNIGACAFWYYIFNMSRKRHLL